MASAVLMIVGNKTDLRTEQSVPAIAGAEFARSVGAFFFEASAKDNKGVYGWYYRFFSFFKRAIGCCVGCFCFFPPFIFVWFEQLCCVSFSPVNFSALVHHLKLAGISEAFLGITQELLKQKGTHGCCRFAQGAYVSETRPSTQASSHQRAAVACR
jgi:hypothetical protein